MKEEIKIEVKNKELDIEDLKRVKDGPGVSDIKQKKGKSLSVKKKGSRIIKIKEKIKGSSGKNDTKKEEASSHSGPKKFKISYLLVVVLFLVCCSVAFLAYFVWQKDKVARIIPENTIFYTRINYNQLKNNYKEGNIGSFVAQFYKKDDFKKRAADYLNKNITSQYGLNFNDDISPIIDKEVVFSSFLTEKEGAQIINQALIIELKDINQTRDVIERILGLKSVQNEYFEEKEISYAIFEEGKLNFYYTFIDNFLILGKNKETLEKIISVQKKKETSLATSKDFLKTTLFNRLKNNYLYLNLSKISAETLSGFKIFNYQGKDLLPLYFVLKKVGSISLCLETDGNSLSLRGFTLFKEKSNQTVRISELVPDRSLGVLSSYNLGDNLLNYLQDLEEEDKNNFSSYSKLEQELISEYNFNLKEDLYPLLQKRSEIILYPNDDYEWAIVINSGNKEKEKLVVEKAERAIAHYFGILNPQEKKFTLADGSEAVEYYSSEEKFSFKDSEIKDFKIRSMQNDKKSSYSYSFLDKQLVFATSKNLLEKIITAQSEKEGLIYSEGFKELTSYNKSNNSLIYIDINEVFDKIGISEKDSLYNLKKLVLKSDSNFIGTNINGFLLVE